MIDFAFLGRRSLSTLVICPRHALILHQDTDSTREALQMQEIRSLLRNRENSQRRKSTEGHLPRPLSRQTSLSKKSVETRSKSRRGGKGRWRKQTWAGNRFVAETWEWVVRSWQSINRTRRYFTSSSLIYIAWPWVQLDCSKGGDQQREEK